MPIYIRKVDKRTWITGTGKTLAERIQAGVGQFRDPEGKPSLYRADTVKDRKIAIAAVAWNRAREKVKDIRKSDFILITEEDLTAAGLSVQPTPSNIRWPILRNRHFEMVRDGDSCTNDDLAGLVRILIERPAEHGRFQPAELRLVARRCSGILARILGRLRAILRIP